MMTSLDGVFAAGDIVRGASLVVWAIRDGRDAAERIHSLSDDQGTGRAWRSPRSRTMLTLYDYMDSGNGYKVRLAAGASRPALQAGRVRHPEGRDAHAGVPGEEPERPHSRPCSSRTARHLAESDAIIWYLAEGTALAPQSRLARAQTLQWMFFEQYSHEPYIAVARFWKHYLPKLTPQQETELPGRMEKGYAALGVMEQHLAHAPVLRRRPVRLGRHRALWLHATSRTKAGSTSTTIPHVNAWLARVAAQPGHVTIDHKN